MQRIVLCLVFAFSLALSVMVVVVSALDIPLSAGGASDYCAIQGTTSASSYIWYNSAGTNVASIDGTGSMNVTKLYVNGLSMTGVPASTLGSWSSTCLATLTTSVTSIIQATQDQLVVVSFGQSTATRMLFKSDSSSTPTTVRATTYAAAGGYDISFTVPVKAGDYWQVAYSSGSGSVVDSCYTIPLNWFTVQQTVGQSNWVYGTTVVSSPGTALSTTPANVYSIALTSPSYGSSWRVYVSYSVAIGSSSNAFWANSAASLSTGGGWFAIGSTPVNPNGYTGLQSSGFSTSALAANTATTLTLPVYVTSGTSSIVSAQNSIQVMWASC